MENLALIESFADFKDEKLIDRVTLMVILEDVFRSTLRRKFGDDENFDIIINPDKGDLEIWRNRVVVKDNEVEDPNQEIELTEARKIEPDFEVGEDVSEEVKLIDLGRRTIQYLRQSLVAKIFEHDSNNIFKQYKDREGDLYTAEVHHIRSREIILLDDDGNELILPKDRQIPSDFFRKGDNVRGIIESVELRGNKPRIIFSRTSPGFLEKLFEQEIPEVFDGLITIKKAVRIPGEKAKVASESGADLVGDDDLAKKVSEGKIDFDLLIATPDMMPTIGKIGKILGPKGLMPNPKLGTVTQDVKLAIENAKKGQIQYKNDKAGIVHAGIGKLNFTEEDLLENLKAFYSSISKSKPDAVKGSFIKKVSIASTMGFGLEINSSFLR